MTEYPPMSKETIEMLDRTFKELCIKNKIKQAIRRPWIDDVMKEVKQ